LFSGLVPELIVHEQTGIASFSVFGWDFFKRCGGNKGIGGFGMPNIVAKMGSIDSSNLLSLGPGEGVVPILRKAHGDFHGVVVPIPEIFPELGVTIVVLFWLRHGVGPVHHHD
jgi:hypothetical protein